MRASLTLLAKHRVMSTMSSSPTSDELESALATGVRAMTPDDVPQVLRLMQGLAAFEMYLDAFAITEDALRQRGFGPNAEFTVLVAFRKSNAVQLLGMAVFYVVPFTFTLQPEMILKELYVTQTARGCGVGRQLMRELQLQARQLGCYQIRWLVMAGNRRAASFYASLGARQDDKWENWQLPIPEEVAQ